MKRNPYEGSFEIISKDDRSFHMKKTTWKHVMELKFSFRTGDIELTKNGEVIYSNEFNLDRFFYFPPYTIKGPEIIKMLSTEATEPLFMFAYKSLSCINYERIKKVSRALLRIRADVELQTLFFCGFTNLSQLNSLHLVKGETVPHKILGVPKYVMSYLKELDTSLCKEHVTKLTRLDTAIGGNNLRLALQIAKEESYVTTFISISDLFLELYENYEYKDVKRLTLYLLREVKLQQGITEARSAATLLRDYSRMSKAMGYPFYEKYTKSLKKDHDITSMNYKVNASEYKNKEFKYAVESVSYVRLAHSRMGYSIIVPDTIQSIINEGSSLSHCVSSYVDDVISGKCKILYLRETKAEEKPLITIEIRDSNIRQVRGNCNRNATPDEMAFVRKWAEKNELKVAVH